MRRIKLTQDQWAIVDDEDFEWLVQFSWNSNPVYKRDKFYWYAVYNGCRPKAYMHRLLLDCQPGEEADHINRNTLDNRKSNLRKVNRAWNNLNHGLSRLNTSGFAGICPTSDNKRWRAYITLDAKQINLGCFKNKMSAIKARKVKQKEICEEHKTRLIFNI